jgi:uncharacterized membrane protein YgdD (TMEM256/DUF423 family)
VLKIAAIMGAIGIAGGAFGAHALKATLSVEALAWWNTSAHYLQIQAVALLVLALLGRDWKLPRATFPLFVFGITIFSGTLWLMALTGTRWLGAITPIGGACLIAGWISLFGAKRVLANP